MAALSCSALLRDAMCMLKAPCHKIRLRGELRADIEWWARFMGNFNGKTLILDKLPIDIMSMDACGLGGGALFNSDWCYINWEVDKPEPLYT